MNGKQYTIMVVEDEELLLQAITKKLQTEGVDVVSCLSGKQALDYLTNMDRLPNALWLDYYLKDMNGLEFVTELKKNPKLESIPILVVSNSAGQDKIQHMLALGVKNYILKAEHRLDEIIKIIEKLIEENPKHAS